MQNKDLADKVVEVWKSLLGTPYSWGKVDCSHLIWLGYKDCPAWPVNGYLTADDIYKSSAFDQVPYEQRQEGDIVCFGDDNTFCDHVVGVIDPNTLIGANSGGSPHPGETPSQYVVRMAAQNAKVKIVGSGYWSSHRIGVRRPPLLNDINEVDK